MDKDVEQIRDTTDAERGETAVTGSEGAVANASRRRFTRGAVIGGAVVLSLGNRAAWSDPVQSVCISDATWLSYVGDENRFMASASATRVDQVKDFEKKVGNPQYEESHPDDDTTCMVRKERENNGRNP
jgi:hypothetical protein